MLIPTRTERHALAQSRRPMGMTRYSLRSENPGMSFSLHAGWYKAREPRLYPAGSQRITDNGLLLAF